MTEYLDVVDALNNPVGVTKLRHLIHRDGDWHRTAQVYIFNRNRELLANLRSPQKEVFPALWDLSIGGHLAPGESYRECAVREMAEELGVDLHPDALQFIAHLAIDGRDDVNGLTDREHAGIFLYRTDKSVADFTVAADEITELRFFPVDLIKESLRASTPAIPIIPLPEKFLATLVLIEEVTANSVDYT